MFPSLDTSEDIARRQVEIWRRMTDLERLRVACDLSATARDLCLAGIRLRHPGASERQVFLRYALITLGPELALKAYPDAAPLLAEGL